MTVHVTLPARRTHTNPTTALVDAGGRRPASRPARLGRSRDA